MERYEKYKDSGIEWIGEIPEHWEMKKLKYVSNIVLGKMLTNSDKGNFHKRKYLRAANIGWLDVNIDDVKEMWFSNNELTRLRLNENDLLVSEGGEVGRTCIWKNELEECYIQNSVHKITLNGSNNPFYYLYQFYLYGQKGAFDAIVNRISIAHLTVEKIRDIDFPVPSSEEQTAIANYLDRKTTEIDELINQKKQLLELYEEEKTAIINQAVTKGINPDAPMKDSGIEWLGKIPEHWEVKRVATFGSFSKGKGIPRSELKDDGFHAILYGDIYTKYNIKAEIIKNHINEETTKTSVALEAGDLLFTGSGETVEDIGKCIAYVGDEAVYAGGDVIILRQKKYDSLFLSYSLSSNASIYQKASMAKGQIIIHIYASNLREIFLPIPQKEEQTTIVQYIETETAKINTKAEKTKKLIELLGEYKQSLISEVVTGKIKVV